MIKKRKTCVIIAEMGTVLTFGSVIDIIMTIFYK